MSVRKRSWKTDRGESREAWVVDYRDQLGSPVPQDLQPQARRRRLPCAGHGRCQRRHPHCRQPQHHGGRSRKVVAHEPGSGRYRALLPQQLPRAPRAAHRALDRRHQARGPHGPVHPRIRRPAAPGSIASHGAQDHGVVLRHPGRCTRPRAGGAERRPQPPPQGRPTGRGRSPGSKSASTSRHQTRCEPSLPGSAAGATGRCCLTAIFTGLRASELRGLRWNDIDLMRNELHVRQRADRFSVIGRSSRPPAGARCRCCRWW